MIEEKRAIILSEGTPVEVVGTTGTAIPTVALIGRSSRQSNAIITLEAHRRGHFLPEIAVTSGDYVNNLSTGEKYLVVGLLQELLLNEVAALVTHMVLCNSKMTVSSLTETVNERGDIVQSDVVTTNGLDCFVEALSSAMKEQNPGLFVDAEYRIFAASVDINTMDKVVLMAGARPIPLKVVHMDYLTYPGTVILHACTETRT
jgi:hypothetical protein